jgi:hypothetical protein
LRLWQQSRAAAIAGKRRRRARIHTHWRTRERVQTTSRTTGLAPCRADCSASLANTKFATAAVGGRMHTPSLPKRWADQLRHPCGLPEAQLLGPVGEPVELVVHGPRHQPQVLGGLCSHLGGRGQGAAPRATTRTHVAPSGERTRTAPPAPPRPPPPQRAKCALWDTSPHCGAPGSNPLQERGLTSRRENACACIESGRQARVGRVGGQQTMRAAAATGGAERRRWGVGVGGGGGGWGLACISP